MKSKVAFILSIISFVGVLSFLGLWVFGSMKLSVVSLDTFVGVVVALLAIIFTILVGWQIINAMEMRDKISVLEKRQNELIENERLLAENDILHTKESYNFQAGLCISNADSYIAKNMFLEAFTFYHSALLYSILSDQPNQSNSINQMQLTIPYITAKNLKNVETFKLQIVSDTDKIRKTISYRNCLSVIYDKTMADFWHKMRELGISMPN